jgi:hypothetical protein
MLDRRRFAIRIALTTPRDPRTPGAGRKNCSRARPPIWRTHICRWNCWIEK